MKREVLTVVAGLIAGGTFAFAQNIDSRDRIRSSSSGMDWRSEAIRQSSRGTEGVKPFNKASQVLGMNVWNHRSEFLGRVHDMVFDLNSGRLSYAVLSVDGGRKLLAIPSTSLSASEDGHLLILRADKAALERAEGLAVTPWPDPAAPLWGARGAFDPDRKELSADYWDNRQGSDTDLSTTYPADRYFRNRYEMEARLPDPGLDFRTEPGTGRGREGVAWRSYPTVDAPRAEGLYEDESSATPALDYGAVYAGPSRSDRQHRPDYTDLGRVRVEPRPRIEAMYDLDRDGRYDVYERRNVKDGRVLTTDPNVFRGRIQSIDPENRTLRVESANGLIRTFTIAERPRLHSRSHRYPLLVDFKPGHNVQVHYWEANGMWFADSIAQTSPDN